MKLQFKRQAYQSAAVDAVADCFLGQPMQTGLSYRIDPGRGDTTPQTRAQAVDEMEGFKNQDIALPESEILNNIQQVQRHQNLPLSTELVKSEIAI